MTFPLILWFVNSSPIGQKPDRHLPKYTTLTDSSPRGQYPDGQQPGPTLAQGTPTGSLTEGNSTG